MSTPEYTIEKFTPELDEVLALTALGFGREPDAKLRAQTVKIVEACADGSYRARQNGQDAAHVLTRTHGDTLWIYSATVLESHRGHGLSTQLMRHALGEVGSRYLGLQTQSPAMYAAARSTTPDIYPNLSGTPLPPEMEEAYRDLFPKGNYPINPGVYDGGQLYDTLPSADNDLARQFYGYTYNGMLFHPEQGDSIVVMGNAA